MEKVLGIIAEYNPFHNGHLYHLQNSKKLTGATHVVAVVGNNFTQRGEVSILDKWTKAKLALENGVDLVIELPSIYSSSSAENFASGAVKILDSLGIVDYLSFGSEAGDIEAFKVVSSLMNNYINEEENPFSVLLKETLAEGNSYPKAMNIALDKISNGRYLDFLTPNNILGLEYIDSLTELHSNITPITIKRTGNNYNDLEQSDTISSATSIRNSLQNNIEEIKNSVPDNTYEILKNINIVPTLKEFEREILFILKRMSLDDISNLPDVSEGLEYKIKDAALSSITLEELIEKIKNKRFTLARIQRILVTALLGITKYDFKMSKHTTPYIRVLGFTQKGKELLSKIVKTGKNPNIITSVKKFETDCSDENLQRMLNIDLLSTYLHNQVIFTDTTLKNMQNNKLPNDYNQKIVEI